MPAGSRKEKGSIVIIAFIAPRFHTNQAELVEQLMSFGNTVLFFSYESRYSEDHRTVSPVIIGYAKLFNRYCNESLRREYGLPSLSGIVSILSSRPDVAIIRSFSLSSLLLSTLLRIRGSKVVLYCQLPIHGKRIPVIKLVYYRGFAREVITPVRGVNGSIGNKIVLGQRWTCIPFIKKPNKEAFSREYCPNGVVRILIVGKFVSRKMIPECLNVLEKLYRGNFAVKVIGTVIENRVLEEVRKIVGRNEYMSIAVNIPHELMDKEYLSSDIFVLPSINEPASYSQLEAMSCGCAVVCSDSNGTAEYIEDGVNGMVFRATEFDASLRECLVSMLDANDVVERMGKAGIEAVSKNHNASAYASYLRSI